MRKVIVTSIIFAIIVAGGIVGAVLLAPTAAVTTNAATVSGATLAAPAAVSQDGTIYLMDNSGKEKYTMKISGGYLQYDFYDPYKTAWTGTPQPLYRFDDWYTADGTKYENGRLYDGQRFYPKMIKNFDYGDEVKNFVQYKDNETTRTDFTLFTQHRDIREYKLNTPSATLDDPFMLNMFAIHNMKLPFYYDERTHFTFTFNTWQSDNLPTYEQQTANRETISFYSQGGRFYLKYGTKTLLSIADWLKKPSGKTYPENTASNYLSFKLEVVQGGRIQWTLEHWSNNNENYKMYSEVLSNRFAYKYGKNETEFFLGLQKVDIPSNYTKYIYKYNYGFLGAMTMTCTRYFNDLPAITVGGKYAVVKKAVDCYVDGVKSFTTHMSQNTFERPELPTHLEREDYTIKWYLDENFTQELLREQHTARDFDNLYGKWIPAEYDVTLVYYTLERFYASINGGKYYEALVKKSVTKTYARDAVIDLADFGANVYYSKFYDNIQRIPFTGWDTDLAAPITGHTTITGNYTFPTATIRYYDVDDKLYGTLTQDMTIFPADLLKQELERYDITHPNWWLHDRPQDEGVVGAVVQFFDSVFRWLFGGDNVGNGVNEQIRNEQKNDTKYIVDQLATAHSKINQYFLPVVYLDINLENLNKGAYGNAAFKVHEEKNPQWHLVSGDPLRNDLVYFADVHSMYSLQNSNFTLVVNFDKQITGFDAFAQAATSFFGWVGGFFGGIFGGLFEGLGGWSIVFVIIGALLLIFCFPLVISLAKALLGIIIFPFKLLAKKLGEKT